MGFPNEETCTSTGVKTVIVVNVSTPPAMTVTRHLGELAFLVSAKDATSLEQVGRTRCTW